jgi:hypothetical protein
MYYFMVTLPSTQCLLYEIKKKNTMTEAYVTERKNF